MSIACGHCKDHHETIADVRACSQATGAAVGPTQAEFRARGVDTAGLAAMGAKMNGRPVEQHRPTNSTERATETREAGQVKTKQRAAEGMYRKAGTIYKVQKAVHGSKMNYAKRLVQTLVLDKKTGKPKFKFEYAPNFVFELRPEHALTIEQAKEFGALYGSCCVCGRTLTKEESIAAGIGPVCAEKF
jgi:hypothetical protein